MNKDGKEVVINVFMDSDELKKLQEHHIVPIGSLDNKLKDIIQKDERNNLAYIYNSPLNFVLITYDTNQTLQNNLVSYYQNKCVKGCFKSIGIQTEENENFKYANSDEELNKILEGRYENLSNHIHDRLRVLGLVPKE